MSEQRAQAGPEARLTRRWATSCAARVLCACSRGGRKLWSRCKVAVPQQRSAAAAAGRGLRRSPWRTCAVCVCWADALDGLEGWVSRVGLGPQLNESWRHGAKAAAKTVDSAGKDPLE
jgi:hypothetical protein